PAGGPADPALLWARRTGSIPPQTARRLFDFVSSAPDARAALAAGSILFLPRRFIRLFGRCRQNCQPKLIRGLDYQLSESLGDTVINCGTDQFRNDAMFYSSLRLRYRDLNRAAEGLRIGRGGQLQHDLPAFFRNLDRLRCQPFREPLDRKGQLRLETVQACDRYFDVVGFARLDGDCAISHNGFQAGHRPTDTQSVEVIGPATVQSVPHGGEKCPIFRRRPFQHRVDVYPVAFFRQFFAFGVFDLEPRIKWKPERSRLNLQQQLLALLRGERVSVLVAGLVDPTRHGKAHRGELLRSSNCSVPSQL